MGKLVKAGLVVLLLLAVPALAETEPVPEMIPPAILIVELQTGSVASATDEFVELYNQTNEAIDLTNYRLQYRSATGTDWLNKATLVGNIEPRGAYLLATAGMNIEANVIGALGLASGGGHLRIVEIVQEAEVVVDQLTWGTGQFAVVTPAPAPAAGESLKRRLSEDGDFIDTNDDSLDFIVSIAPTPEFTPSPAIPEVPPESEPTTEIEPDSAEEQPETQPTTNEEAATGVNYPRLEISELLIDPDKPATDAEDEFVELYNPNAEAVDLEGYMIQTGSKYSYKFTLPNISLGAKKYLALYALDTGLVLSNSGGGARLLTPAGAPMYEVPAYTKAKPDTAWANISGLWQWTAKPTPNAANLSAATAGAARSSTSASSANTNSRTYLNRGQVAGDGTEERSVYEEPESTNDDQLNTVVVAGVGGLALLYAGNEYRHDVGNFFAKIRRHLASRRKVGA